jgi:hypothetical protein
VRLAGELDRSQHGDHEEHGDEQEDPQVSAGEARIPPRDQERDDEAEDDQDEGDEPEDDVVPAHKPAARTILTRCVAS